MGCVIGKSSSSASASAADGGEDSPPQLSNPPSPPKPTLRHHRHSRRVPPPPPVLPPLRTPDGWPDWLSAVAGDAIDGIKPRRANSFEKLDKIGQGTYSNVYKARDLMNGKIVALKKVRFDNLEPESVRFMAKEILLLRKLDRHPNIMRLEGLVTSRMSCSLYLIFEYMEHDLAGLAALPGVKFTESQVKCYMKQLLSGLEHCHSKGVLHRDIKCSNLLIDNQGILKIADFGLASTYDPQHKRAMTSRVVTLWYRPPELLLGATHYGVGVDLWSAGCILAELLAGKPILPGRTEVEQLHRIFKLCGSPSDEYWKKSKLPHATIFKPQQPYNCCIAETFKDFPPYSIPLIQTLLSIDPTKRGTATSALKSEFFTSKPLACDPSSLPHYPPSKEIDAKLRIEEARRGQSGKSKDGSGVKKHRARDRGSRAIPAPQANAELQQNLDHRRLVVQRNAMSKSEKFPPPHQDGLVGKPSERSHNDPLSFIASNASFASSIFDQKKGSSFLFSSSLGKLSKKTRNKDSHAAAPPWAIDRILKPSSLGPAIDRRSNGNVVKRVRGKELEVFGG